MWSQSSLMRFFSVGSCVLNDGHKPYISAQAVALISASLSGVHKCFLVYFSVVFEEISQSKWF